VNFTLTRIYGLETDFIYLVNKILICDCLGMQVFNLNFSLTSPAVRNYFHVIIPPSNLCSFSFGCYTSCPVLLLSFAIRVFVITDSYIQFSVSFVELNDTGI